MTPKALIAHHNALITLVRHLLDDRTGGMFTAAVETLTKVIGAKGALAYRMESNELVLVTETGVPRKAKAWLARMPIDDQPWFIAQRVAVSQKAEVDTQLADARVGRSIRPVLEAAGWRALAGAPIRMGRHVFGVIVVATSGGEPDRQTMLLLETICGLLALSSERDHSIARARDDKQREAKTAQLATMGLLASIVARDLATPLASIQMRLEAQEIKMRELREKLVAALGDDEAREIDALEEVEVLTAEIGENIRHTQGITSRLLSFSRETKPETIDLTMVLHSAIQLLREGIDARGIMLEVEGDDQSLMVDGRDEALQMLVVQLVLHAADEIDAAKVRGAKILVQLVKEPGSCVIAVASSGRSGPRANVQLFDAMMRDLSAQSAAGLEIARQTAAAHGGQIEMGASELGGPLIRVILPDASVTPSVREMPRRRLSTGSRRLIVWIDEDGSRVKTLSRLITTHETLIAGSIAEATELLDSLDHLPELVVCEVALSDGYGVDLHCEVDPEIAERFVFVTGGVVSEDVASYLKSSGRPTLIRPVSVEEVRALLRTDSPSAPPMRTTSSAPPSAPGSSHSPSIDDGTHPGHRVNISPGVGASLFGQSSATEPIHMRRQRRTNKRRDTATAQEGVRGPDSAPPDGKPMDEKPAPSDDLGLEDLLMDDEDAKL